MSPKRLSFSFGAGMRGCMYDYGPEFADSVSEAIESLMHTFADALEEGEYVRMVASLTSDGYHRFANPDHVGSEYCEIVEGETE